MAHFITLQPGNHKFPVEAGENILDASLKHGYRMPFLCRDGSCGMCKGRVMQGVVDHGKAWDGALTPAEKAAGMALFCCAKPQSDLTIEYRPVGSPVGTPANGVETKPDADDEEIMDAPEKTISCRVEKMERLADDVMVLHLKLPAGESIQFLAGQHINVLTKDGRQHSFPLGNAPHDSKVLQLHIRNIPGNAFTQHVFTEMKARSTLRITEPLGALYLRKGSRKDAIFIAEGIGIASIKAMIEHTLHTRMGNSIHVYWGLRKPADMYLPDLAKQWQAHGIFFTTVLSEPRAEDGWRGRTGSVQEAVLENYGDLSQHQIYACGSREMVESAKHKFTTQWGLPAGEFFSNSLRLI